LNKVNIYGKSVDLWGAERDMHNSSIRFNWSPLSFIKNKWIKKVATRLQIKGDNKKGKALALNLMRCEAHYDMSKEVLIKKINK